MKKCFESIDRDGSGTIDKGELVFALTQLGLETAHAHEIMREGDRDEDDAISMPEFFALVATVTAREAQRDVQRRPSKERATSAGRAPSTTAPGSRTRPRAASATPLAATEAAHSLRDLVDRAASFPIGLLANAQHVSNLVASFDPAGYAERCAQLENQRATRETPGT